MTLCFCPFCLILTSFPTFLTLQENSYIWCLSKEKINVLIIYIYNIRTLSVNIKFICTSFRNRQNSEPTASFSGLFRSQYKWILYLTTMYVYCVYPAMSKKSENLSELNKKDRNKRHSSPFINVVKGVFFVVRVTLVSVSYLSAPSAVHSYRVPGKFIRTLSLNIRFICTRCETGLKSSPIARYSAGF
jgi:hypothetical protein